MSSGNTCKPEYPFWVLSEDGHKAGSSCRDITSAVELMKQEAAKRPGTRFFVAELRAVGRHEYTMCEIYR